MSEKIAWTKAEMAQFDRITWALSSRAQMQRLDGQFRIKAFIEKHGREKCDAMFAALKERDRKKAEAS